jgi:hypothetical protein
MVISGNEFGFGEEYVKPLMEVCFSWESSGKDLISTVPSVKTSVRPTPEVP